MYMLTVLVNQNQPMGTMQRRTGFVKQFAGQMMGGFTTTVKMSIKEYEDSGIKIGDKIYIDITKPESKIQM